MPGEGPFAAIPGSVKAAVWLLLSGLSFVGMIVLVRLCAAEMHPLNLAVWACLMALLWLLPTLLSDPGLLRREPLSREAGVRALLAVVATEALFAAVTSAPFAPVVALLSLAPVVAGPGRVGGRAMLPTAVAALCGAVLLLSEAAPATYPGLAAAAAAVLAALRGELRQGDRMIGLTQGFGRFLEMARAEPTLAVRLDAIAREMVDALAAVLAQETAAAPTDPTPRLVAAQLGWVQAELFGEIGRRSRDGQDPGTIAEAALALLDTLESLLSARVLGYATR
jgi:uncharacterized membrane protein